MFTQTLIAWTKVHGRKHLPWIGCKDPYRVWLSEIMLQQTQAETAVAYYERFLAHFPDVFTLAKASVEEVLHLFSGLGYYRRAVYLHQTAQRIANDCHGIFPQDPEVLQTFPGIGRSTAAAIAVFSFGKKAAILDGNVKRILSRVFLVQEPSESKRTALLWRRAENLLPEQDIETYTQGLMDFGSTLCTPKAPLCGSCPMAAFCKAYLQNRVDDLPVKKSPLAKHDKTFWVPLITFGNATYLEKRPALGIWAQMWMMPLFENEESCSSFLSHFTIDSCEPLVPMRHELTHLRLQLNPVLAKARQGMRQVGEKNVGFFTVGESQNLAMPKPGRVLLDWLVKDKN